MWIHRRPTQTVWAYVRITCNDEQFLNSDTLIFDETTGLPSYQA